MTYRSTDLRKGIKELTGYKRERSNRSSLSFFRLFSFRCSMKIWKKHTAGTVAGQFCWKHMRCSKSISPSRYRISVLSKCVYSLPVTPSLGDISEIKKKKKKKRKRKNRFLWKRCFKKKRIDTWKVFKIRIHVQALSFFKRYAIERNN